MKRGKLFAEKVDALNSRVGRIASYLILPLVALSSLEVALRYLFNRPTIWIWDVNIQIQLVVVVLTAGYAMLSDKFVAVDIFIGRLSAGARAKLDLFFSSMVMFFCLVIITYEAVIEAWNSLITRERYTSIWSPPLYPIRIIMAIGIILLLLQVVSRFIHILSTLKKEDNS